MLKIIAILIIFLACTYIGFYYGENFKKRSSQLSEILKGLLLLNNEVMYTNTPLPEALRYVALKVDYPLRNLLLKVSENLVKGECESVYEAFKTEYKKEKHEFRIIEEDTLIISDFLKSLGESGVYGQDKIFNLAIENIKGNCKTSEVIASKNTKMYRALGLCIGAMLSLFLM
ncbi:stage III sporulation protein SpoIIIAB [Clostridium chauvoei]|uniref:stage III sporulation protein SpoIIIAB n=1 Tax=Clostridium chauvoei TaxID=46867 RepID=UPI002079E724|nr:stage III sporulation protein SpoIIIAB [Clostridium chauvoei]